jgi:hypothetical protein
VASSSAREIKPVGQIAVEPDAGQSEEFSLVFCGPFYQLLLRSKLIRPPFGNLRWRIGVITAVAWLPLVPLTIFGGCFAGGVRVPFLYDAGGSSAGVV